MNNFTPRAQQVLALARKEADRFHHNYVGTEHILLGLLREQEGVAAQVLMNLGLKLEEVREEVLNLLGAGVELHPALVIFGVSAGGELAGIAGGFISIPTLALLRIIYRRVLKSQSRDKLVPV